MSLVVVDTVGALAILLLWLTFRWWLGVWRFSAELLSGWVLPEPWRCLFWLSVCVGAVLGLWMLIDDCLS